MLLRLLITKATTIRNDFFEIIAFPSDPMLLATLKETENTKAAEKARQM